MNYTDFFHKATGLRPFSYQDRLGTSEQWPSIVEAPTGAGKTAAVVLAWLWRRVTADTRMNAGTPRRLVYCLPMRVLVEQTFAETKKWLTNAGLGNRVDLSVIMGGEDPGDWHLQPQREAILIGTQDMLLSRALNRGYGASRFRWPIDFGLLNHDCLWVFDEVQLMGGGLATTAQMQAFRETLGTFVGCRCVWMSATLRPEWLATVDFKPHVKSLQVHGIDPADRGGALKLRLEAPKVLRKCSAAAGNFKAIAQSVLESHEPATLTLVVLNTVERAVKVYEALRKETGTGKPGASGKKKTGPKLDPNRPNLLLIHSRFRPIEKSRKIDALLGHDLPDAGTIAVTTQVVEAGVDVSAKNLFTDLAPWPSLVQRFGRCNRKGEYQEAGVHWIDVLSDDKGNELKDKKRRNAALPYDPDELTTAREQLRNLLDVGIARLERHIHEAGEDVVRRLFPYEPMHVIRKKDLIELFDTTPDLAGNDIDVSRFIRDGDDLDVQVFWRDIAETHRGPEENAPSREELCSVPVHGFRAFLKDGKAYQWDHLDDRWMRARADDVFPGRSFLIPSSRGGYDPETGWNPTAKNPVPPVGSLQADVLSPEGIGDDRYSTTSHWELMSEHAERTVKEMGLILKESAILFSQDIVDALKTAARMHDWGKAHEVFVNAFAESLPDETKHWAKAPHMKRYQRKGFRHDLAGALAVLQNDETPLAAYLVASHHGKVRLSIRSLPNEQRPPDPTKRFARGIWDGDTLPAVNLGSGVATAETVLSLEPMELGLSPAGKPSWAELMLDLRDDPELGPFRLAFLEALLRAADVRAGKPGSAAHSNAKGKTPHDRT